MITQLLSILSSINFEGERQQDAIACGQKLFQNFGTAKKMVIYDQSSVLVEELIRVALNGSTQVVRYGGHGFEVDRGLGLITLLSSNASVVGEVLAVVSRLGVFHGIYLVMFFGGGHIGHVFAKLPKLESMLLVDKNGFLFVPHQVQCDKATNWRFLGSCTMVELPRPGRKDFLGCQVRVIARKKSPFVVNIEAQLPGMEIDVLNLAGKNFNFSLTFVPQGTTQLGEKLYNGSYSGLLKWLYEGRAEILIGNMRSNQSFLEDFTIGEPYFPNKYYFYVPAALEVSKWAAIGYVFDPALWSLVLVVLILEALWVQLSNMVNGRTTTNLGTFGVMVDQSVRKPKRYHKPYVYMLWTWYGFIITSSYRAKLLSFLIKPTFGHALESIGDIANSKLDFGGVIYSRSYFEDAETPSEKYIYHNWMNCPHDTTCIKRVVFKRDMAIMENEYFVLYHRNNLLDKKMRPGYHRLKNGISYYVWMLMQKGLPMRDSINGMILAFREFGVLDQIRKRYFTTRRSEKDQVNVQMISMDQILLLYYIYSSGCVLALFVFALECLKFLVCCKVDKCELRYFLNITALYIRKLFKRLKIGCPR